MRILLFTGKGGVGKTSVAAATGIKTASLGYRSLIISTDPAHSLADCVEKPLGYKPAEIGKNLFGVEVNVQEELEANWGEVKDYLAALFASQGLEQVVAEEMAVLPGSDEIASLLHISKYHQENMYDVLLVDCAPTGESLKLLTFPEVIRWYMEKIFGLERRVLKVLRPIAKAVIPAPLPSDRVMKSIEYLYSRISYVKDILEDPRTTSIRLVLNPEKMVVKETQRAYAYLSLFGYPVDAVVVNRIIPRDVNAPYFDNWRKIQSEYISTVEESFYPLKMFHAKLFDREIVGKEILREMADDIYRDMDPAQGLVDEQPVRITKDKEGYIMLIKLPFTSKEEVNLHTTRDELILRLRNWKRVFLLPQVLVGLNPQKAELKDGVLEIKWR
ncbi:MAG: ArsA family ATPase [Candidatus Bathyarchaeia archaeon]